MTQACLGIIDDDQGFVSDLTEAVAGEPDLTVAWTVRDLASARVVLAGDHRVDAVVVSFRLPDGPGISLLSGALPAGVRTIMVSSWDRPIYRQQAARLGAAATVTRDAPVQAAIRAIRGAIAAARDATPEADAAPEA